MGKVFACHKSMRSEFKSTARPRKLDMVAVPVTPALVREEKKHKQIPEAHGPASLDEWMSYGFSDKPCGKTPNTDLWHTHTQFLCYYNMIPPMMHTLNPSPAT